MAADILLYKGTHVPVGEDQKQHLELARDIAQKFNNDFCVDFFPIVEPLILGAATRVMSLRDGTSKMSKSDPSALSRIDLTDNAEMIAKKIRKAKTDLGEVPSSSDEFAGRPEATNLIRIYAALADQDINEVCNQFGGKQFSVFKQSLAELAIEELNPIQKKFRQLMDDPAYLDNLMNDGAQRARAISEPILKEVHDIIGFFRSKA
jgi:tryptophanyl-tRNA synthetase